MKSIRIPICFLPRFYSEQTFFLFVLSLCFFCGVSVRATNRGPRSTVEFVSEPRVSRQPNDLYVVRFTRLDGRYGWSTPLRLDPEKPESTIDDQPAGQVDCPPSVFGINSIPVVGCRHRLHLVFSNPYHGDISDLTVVASPVIRLPNGADVGF